jgi:mono/diheme cytochrome c family protein
MNDPARRLRTTIALLALAACRDRIGTGWDWNRMREQPKAVTYGSSAAFANGMAMRTPPPGTVAREVDSAWSGSVDLARGAGRFHIYCAACHGERGDGQSIVASNMEPQRPPSLLSDSIRGFTAEHLDQVMIHGYGRMPGLGAALTAEDRRAVRAYIARLQSGETRAGQP